MRQGGSLGRGALATASPATIAILYMAAAAALSSLLHVGVRIIAADGIPASEIVFLRTLFTIALTMPFVFRPGNMAWRTRVPHWHIARGAVGTLSMWGWYYALSNMPLGDAATLGQTTGLFVVLGAALLFREQVGLARWIALATGMLGAVIVLKPSGAGISFAAVCALGSSFLWAMSLLISKALSRRDSAITIAFYQPLTIAPWALLFALPYWVTPSAAALVLMIGMAAAAGLSNYCMIKALAMADASITAPIDYTKLLWTTLAAYLLFGEAPGATTWIGGGLIVAASLIVALYGRGQTNSART